MYVTATAKRIWKNLILVKQSNVYGELRSWIHVPDTVPMKLKSSRAYFELKRENVKEWREYIKIYIHLQAERKTPVQSPKIRATNHFRSHKNSQMKKEKKTSKTRDKTFNRIIYVSLFYLEYETWRRNFKQAPIRYIYIYMYAKPRLWNVCTHQSVCRQSYRIRNNAHWTYKSDWKRHTENQIHRHTRTHQL